jgi:hypothetical protein
MIEAVREHLPSVICVVRAQSIINGSAAAAHVCCWTSRSVQTREPDPLTGYYYSDTFPIHNTHTHTPYNTKEHTKRV